MKKRTTVAIYFMFLFGLVNCTGVFRTPAATNTPKLQSHTSPTVPVASTSSPTKPSPTVTPISASTVAASTLSPAQTATTEFAEGLTRNCFNILPALPQPNDYQGKLILNKVYTYYYYSYDFQTAQTTKLPNRGLLNIVVSPDGKKYAYHDENSPYLQIYSSDAHLQRSIPWEKDWFWMDGWLDNNQLVFEIPAHTTNPFGMLNIEYPEPLMLLNLTTNQRQKLLPDYPGIDAANNQTNWWSGTTVYDASLSRVVYPGWIINGVEAGYNLWDVPNKRKIVGLSAGNYDQGPEWWPDGSKFIVNVDNAFYIVTRDGVISKLADLVALDTSSPAFGLSPDGRSVALWIGDSTGNYYTLAVLDTQTGKITDYCIHSEYGRETDPNPPEPPVWAPDGKAFVVSASTSVGQPEGDTILT